MGKLGDILKHPDEFLPLVRVYLASKAATKLPDDPDLAFCYGILNNVSRSFALVIQQLQNPLRDAICVFYLVLRGLDTVEDDMAIPVDIKVPALLKFHESIYDRTFKMDCGDKHYKTLMAQFGTVTDVFLRLEKPFQDVIAEITRRMGNGMAKFIEQDVVTVADYDEYCHYVAGLVGVGLSKLFVMAGLEDASYAEAEELSNHMGLLLQKTNIIRDYLEDIMEVPRPRMFWPRAIWGKFATELEDLKEPVNRQNAVHCLNAMVTDALQHLPHCLRYMQGLQDRNVFRFCAIPQVMAMGTLALCYNNGKVFEGVVKMRRGETAVVFDSLADLEGVCRYFLRSLSVMEAKVQAGDAADPTLKKTAAVVDTSKALVEKALLKVHQPLTGAQLQAARWWPLLVLLLLASYVYSAWSGSLADYAAKAGNPLLDTLAGAGMELPHKAASAVLLVLWMLKTVTHPVTVS